MKKILIITFLASILFFSCNQSFIVNNTVELTSNSEITDCVHKLKEAGLLDSLISNSRSVTTEENEAVIEFINNTEEVLKRMRESESGEKEIEIINALFTGRSIDEFIDSFSLINSEKAEELSEYVNQNFQKTENQFCRSISNNSNIKFSFATKDFDCFRSAYASDLEWDTIGWYTGFCASTIAGFYLMSYGGFWLKIAGTVAATAGAASMVTQLIKWNNCSDLGKFVSSLLNKDSISATKILNSDDGVKILTITTETTATVTACCFTPAGKILVKTVVYYINIIIDKILTVLPSGINYSINGIPIRIITI